MTYVELHARSAFSFLRGASLPEELAGVCAGLGMPAMALARPRWCLRRAALPFRSEEGRHPRARRRGGHRYRWRNLPAAGPQPHGLPESLPPHHAHEAAREEIRGRGAPGGDRGIRRGPRLPHRRRRWPAGESDRGRHGAAVPGATRRGVRPRKCLRGTTAAHEPRGGSAQPGRGGTCARGGHSAARHQRRMPRNGGRARDFRRAHLRSATR